MDALDVCLGRAEVERSDLDPQLIITNLVSFYALSETKQVFRTEHLARNVQCSLQPGSAKAGSVSGNGKGTLCLSKDFSTAVTHGRGKEPSCTRQYTFFECFLYCQQLVVSVHSQQTARTGLFWVYICPQCDSGGLSGRGSVLPTSLWNQEKPVSKLSKKWSEQPGRIIFVRTSPPWKATTLCFSRVAHLRALPHPVFRACAWSLSVHTCKAQLNLSLLNFTPTSKPETIGLTELLPSFPPCLQVKAAPSLCSYVGFSWQ